MDVNIRLEESESDKLLYGAYTKDGLLAGLMQVGIQPLQYIIEGIYVAPKYRGFGVGTRLMDSFLDILDDDIMLPCDITFTEAEGGKSLIGFMRSRNDFLMQKIGVSYSVHIKELLRYKALEKVLKKGVSTEVISLENADTRIVNELVKDLKNMELDRITRTRSLKDFYDTEISSICVSDGKISSAILARRSGNDEVIIEVMYVKEKGTAAIQTMGRTAKNVFDLNPNMTVSMFCINEASERIVDKLTENAKNVTKSDTYLANWLMIPNLDMIDIMVMQRGY